MASTFEIAVETVMAKVGPGIKHELYKKSLYHQAAPNRFVFVPFGGTINALRMAGPNEITLSGVKWAVKPIYEDALTVEVFIWARDFENWERCRNRLLSAVRSSFGSASVPGPYSIDTEQAKSGEMYGEYTAGFQRFTWQFIVAEYSSMTTSEAGTLMPVRRLAILQHQTHICFLDVGE